MNKSVFIEHLKFALEQQLLNPPRQPPTALGRTRLMNKAQQRRNMTR